MHTICPYGYVQFMKMSDNEQDISYINYISTVSP